MQAIYLFKGSEKTSSLNYLAVSLTGISTKGLEHIIYSHVIQFLERHRVIFSYQSAFRNNYSCWMQLAGFVYDIHSIIDFSGQVDAICHDFSDAFDWVPNHHLITETITTKLRGRRFLSDLGLAF